MDPLSVAASVIAVLQAANAIISVCYDFKAILRDGAPWGLGQVLGEMQDLRSVLESLVRLTEATSEKSSSSASSIAASHRRPPLELLCDPDRGPLVACARELKALDTLITSSFDSRSGSKRRALMQAVGWQVKEKEVRMALERVTRCKNTLALAMTVDQAELLIDIQDMTASLKLSMSAVEADLDGLLNNMKSRELDERQRAILQWLSPTDPLESHEAALRLHQSGTNSWFTRCVEFKSWFASNRSFLWLSGFPGAGKTVLFSNTVAYLSATLQEQKSTSNLAFFYCDFRRPKSQDVANLLGSLVAQICSRTNTFPSLLEQAFDQSHSGPPGQKKPPTLAVLQSCLESFAAQSDLILLVDAIDECQQRSDVFEFFAALRTSCSNVRVLLTSREEAEIESGLHSFDHFRIEGHLNEVNDDVQAYVAHRLSSDRNLQWLNDSIKDEIANQLMRKSAGMFRWVQCQIDAIGSLRTVKAIRLALRELPKGLDETYDKILGKVSSSDIEIVRRILVWISFTMLPLTLREVHEAIAIEVGLDELDEDSRLRSPQDILDLCGSLISLSESGHVRLAHLSVREYLLSSSIKRHPTLSVFALDDTKSNHELALNCLTYLSFRDMRTGPCTTAQAYTERIITFPLIGYAALCWTYFVRRTTADSQLRRLISDFFSPRSRSTFMSWVQIINASNEAQWNFYPHHATPLYYAASFGLIDTVKDIIQDTEVDLDAPGSRFGGTALHAAVLREHIEVMELLLAAGANPNQADWNLVSPLHSAALYGSEKVIRVLLDHGASVEAMDSEGRTPRDWALNGWEPDAQRLVLRAAEAKLRVVKSQEETSKKSDILSVSGRLASQSKSSSNLTIGLGSGTGSVSVHDRDSAGLSVPSNTSRRRSSRSRIGDQAESVAG
ncbi:hypothetical protein PV10_03121 [Exophiala mesophila]|uniref:Uncharacterized protein n=1 Tax=Exophiala mesophila TaxID=212818 RepID=A0A0D1ZLI7_EXOME|nr:uncharacterized protein PV10_03121 [Exophiala mesophila]KIV95467.1 hypothetical protein PV10_03121 [Exophiala mesophila]